MSRGTACSVIFMAFLGIAALPALCFSQDDPSKDHAVLPESFARQSAVETIMPIYSKEAVRRGISGLVHVKIEISRLGEVVKIKTRPHTNPLLRDSVAEAVSQWRFKPFRGQDGLAMPSISRLIFSFRLQDQEPFVEMHNPGPDAPDTERLGYCNSAKELKEWKHWEEVPFTE